MARPEILPRVIWFPPAFTLHAGLQRLWLTSFFCKKPAPVGAVLPSCGMWSEKPRVLGDQYQFPSANCMAVTVGRGWSRWVEWWCWNPLEQDLLELIYCHLQLITSRGYFKVAFVSIHKKLKCFSDTAVEKYRMKFVQDLDALSKMCWLMKNRRLYLCFFFPLHYLLPLYHKWHSMSDIAGGWLKVSSPARDGVTLGKTVSSHQSTNSCLWFPWHLSEYIFLKDIVTVWLKLRVWGKHWWRHSVVTEVSPFLHNLAKDPPHHQGMNTISSWEPQGNPAVLREPCILLLAHRQERKSVTLPYI